MLEFSRRLLSDVLSARGYEIRDRRLPLRSPGTFFEQAGARGFRPGTVIDVGVGFGTDWLMKAFPDAWTVLIEPNSGFRDPIARLMAGRRGETHFMGAGAVEGMATLHVRTDVPTSSSLLGAAGGDPGPLEAIEVPVRPLDSLDRSAWPGPYLLKLDCEGFELEVLKGARDTLGQVEMIVSEVALQSRHEKSFDFAAFVAAVDALDFALYDIVDMQPFGPSGRVSYLDGVFVARSSALWRD